MNLAKARELCPPNEYQKVFLRSFTGFSESTRAFFGSEITSSTLPDAEDPLSAYLTDAAHEVTYGTLKILIKKMLLDEGARKAFSEIFFFVTGVHIDVGDLFRPYASSYIHANYCHRMFRLTILGQSWKEVVSRGEKYLKRGVESAWRLP